MRGCAWHAGMQDDGKIPEHVARLLASSIESEQRLDILLHLRASPGKSFTARAVAATLPISSASAEQHLAILCGRGFLTVSIGSDLLYAYQPVSPAIDAAVAEIERLVHTCRGAVVAALREANGKDPVRAFANAFVIRTGPKGATKK
jgi:predicted ArsR family transcriptional regulator